MEIKQLQLFLAAAETLSFTEAAQRCYTVQSAVSQQIAALEKEMGAPLFIREKRTLRLTPEGEVLMKETQVILARLSHAKTAVQSVSQGYLDSLHIGRQGDLMREKLPKVLRTLLKENPHLRLNFTRGNTQELMSALENGEIDCMLTVFFPEHRLYQWVGSQVICREKIRVMIAADHPLASRRMIPVSELSSIPMILMTGSDKRAHLADMAAAGYSDSVYTYVDSQNTIEQLVAAGCGFSPLASSAVRAHPDLAYIDLENAPEVELAVLWNKNRTVPALESFIRLLKENA